MSSLEIVKTIIETVGWVAIVGAAWHISARIASLETLVSQILTNHLPHIEDELKMLKESYADFTTLFLQRTASQRSQRPE